jgi:mono/diheme cytochrome c family protein
MKKILLIVIGSIAAILIGFTIFINLSYEQSFDEKFPVKELIIKADSAMVARGEYLAYGPAHCGHCHSPLDKLEAVDRGEAVVMTGGFVFDLPIGKVYSPNLSSDPETGIGGLSDGQLYRMLRHNVRRDGAACLELMPFTTMSDYDIHSIIAFLRTQPAVKNEVPKNDYNFLGKMIRSLAIKPADPGNAVAANITPDSSVAYGKYLCESVANCRGCHTNRDLKTGAFIGEPYAGGFQMGPDASTANYTFVTPNITPDPTTGILVRYDETRFMDRMRGGRIHQTSPMPWGSFKRLSDNDLKAIYRFLKTVKSVNNPIAQTVIPPAEK